MSRKPQFQPGGWKLLVKRSSAGLGLFAGEDIPKGACLIEYVGRPLSHEEEYTSRSKYLFEINSRLTIDGQARSNTARYINHSCKPNADPEIRNRRIFIMALKNIPAGEEITYNYGEEYWNEHIGKDGCRCHHCAKK